MGKFTSSQARVGGPGRWPRSRAGGTISLYRWEPKYYPRVDAVIYSDAVEYFRAEPVEIPPTTVSGEEEPGLIY